MGRKNHQKQQAKKEAVAQTVETSATTEATQAVTETISHEAIAARAHAIWLQEGRMFGNQASNWFRAENELRLELANRKSN